MSQHFAVIVLGETLCDLFCVDDHDQPVTYDQTDRYLRIAGGAPTNFATGLARQGHTVRLLGQIGQDQMGRFLERRLMAEGIDLSFLGKTSVAKTGVSFVSVAADGQRSFDFYRVPSADQLFSPELVTAALPLHCRLFHFGTNCLLFANGQAATQLALASLDPAIIVSCDLNLRLHLWSKPEDLAEQCQRAISQTDWLKISDEELWFVTGSDNPDQAAERLLALGPELVVVTAGAAGARAYRRGRPVMIVPAAATRVVDTTGAGDAFWSGLVGHLLGADLTACLDDDAVLRTALAHGARNAASVIASVGASPGLLTGTKLAELSR